MPSKCVMNSGALIMEKHITLEDVINAHKQGVITVFGNGRILELLKEDRFDGD